MSISCRPGTTDLARPLVNTWNVDSRDELNGWWLIRVFIAAVDVHTVDAVLVCALLTLAATVLSDLDVGFVCVRVEDRVWCRSSCSSSSHRHQTSHTSMPLAACQSRRTLSTLLFNLPAPNPFSPFSSSSSSRKLRGTLALIL